jgi:hypothetical protein
MVDPYASVPACGAQKNSTLAEIFKLPASADDEQIAWRSFAEEQDKNFYLPKLRKDIESVRSAIAAEVSAKHWHWASAVRSKTDDFNRAVGAAMDSSFTAEAPADLAMAALGDVGLSKLRARLDQESAVLGEIGQKVDPLHDVTVDDIREWQERVSQAIAATPAVTKLREEIEAKADNTAWDTAVASPTTVSFPEGLAAITEHATRLPEPSAFDQFLAQAAAFRLLSGQVRQAEPSNLHPFTRDAAVHLVDDCTALLTLDENAFDEVCGAAAPALTAALHLLDRNISDGSSGDSQSRPPLPSDGSAAPRPPVGPDASAEAQLTWLKEQLHFAGRAAVDTSDLFPANVRSTHVAALEASIAESSRAYAEASYFGYMEGAARAEARLELVHEALRGAVDGVLPESLADPLALLSTEEAQAVLTETRRLQRTIQRNLALVPDVPEFEVAAEALAEQAQRLERVITTGVTKSDLAGVVRQIDPEKAKALHTRIESQLSERVERHMKVWADRFVGLPARVDTWRGPRGPPTPDPRYPRSHRVLAAIKELGRNPTDAIRAFAALRAEHIEFYRSVDAEGGQMAKLWRYGRNNPRAWMMSLMSPRDLAVASDALQRAAAVGPTVEIAEGWVELVDAARQLQDAILAEHEARKVIGSGHPPGYPPGRPPSVRLAAERYILSWSERPATPIEQQLRLQVARQMFADIDAMPSAVRAELRDVVGKIVDAEAERTRSILLSLYGSDGQGGLLDRAARSTERLSDIEMQALATAKARAERASEIVAERVAAAERDGFIGIEPERWNEIRGWFGRFGRDAPPAGVASGSPRPVQPGSGGAVFLFADAELESNFVKLQETLQQAEASLQRAEGVAQRSIVPPLVGEQQGRAVANRLNWSNGEFRFDGMRLQPESAATPRYPEELSKWRGFFDTDGKPFDYSKYVQNFTNFRGVGGGIHFGETTTPAPGLDETVERGALLSYDDAPGMIRLRLVTGEVYSYGPVEPRVLKALYSYVTAQPGINLAITIGATGEGRIGSGVDGSPVLLDPRFVDNPVGQELYLADIVPWSLDAPTLPNGEANPASAEFAKALEAFREDQGQVTKNVEQLIDGVKPLNKTSALDWTALLESDEGVEILLGAAAVARDWADLKKVYADARATLALRSVDFRKDLAAVASSATELQNAGYSAEHIETAINLVDRSPVGTGSILGNDLPGELVFDLQPGSSLKAAQLAKAFREIGLRGEDLLIYRLAAIHLRTGEAGVRQKLRDDFAAGHGHMSSSRPRKLHPATWAFCAPKATASSGFAPCCRMRYRGMRRVVKYVYPKGYCALRHQLWRN